MDNVEIFCLHFVFQKLLTSFYCFEFFNLTLFFNIHYKHNLNPKIRLLFRKSMDNFKKHNCKNNKGQWWATIMATILKDANNETGKETKIKKEK